MTDVRARRELCSQNSSKDASADGEANSVMLLR